MKSTSLELSKQLRKAGAKQELKMYDKYWSPDANDEWRLCVYCGGDISWVSEYAKSFDCHELLEGLPLGTELSIDRLGCISSYKGAEFGGDRHNVPAEALGKLYLWCLQNGHIKEAKHE